MVGNIVGNILTILVFRRKRLKSTSYSIYFCSLMSFEIIGLVYAFRYWARFFLGFDVRLINSFFCKSDKFVTFSTGIAADCFLTIILADRLLAVIFYNRFKILKKSWFQKLVVAVVLFYSTSINSFFIFNHDLTRINQNEHDKSWMNFTYICEKNHDRYERVEQAIVIINLVGSILLNTIMHIILLVFIFQSRQKLNRKRARLFWIKDVKFAVSTSVLTLFELSCKLFFGLIQAKSSSLKRNISLEEYQAYYYMGLNIITLSYGATFYFNLIFNSIFYEEFLALLRVATFHNCSSCSRHPPNVRRN